MIKDSPYFYGLTSKLFHWILAALIITNLTIGLVMDGIAMPTKLTVIFWHKSIGATVLIFMVLRLAWRTTQGFPKMPEAIPAWQQQLARLGHLAFYPLLILLPLSGWLLSSAAGYPVSVFGLFTLPDLVSKNKDLRKIFETTHDVLGYMILVLVIGHVLAALYHHFVQKTKLIRRML